MKDWKPAYINGKAVWVFLAAMAFVPHIKATALLVIRLDTPTCWNPIPPGATVELATETEAKIATKWDGGTQLWVREI